MLPECVAVGSVHTITQPRWMVDEARISQQGHSGLSVRSYVEGAEPRTVRIFARYRGRVVVGELVWDRKVYPPTQQRRRSLGPPFGCRKGRSQDIYLNTSSNQ